jgi:hypothetical protein
MRLIQVKFKLLDLKQGQAIMNSNNKNIKEKLT